MSLPNTEKPGALLPDFLTPMTIMNLRARQLNTVLQNGEWHLANDIAKMLGLNEYIRQILCSQLLLAPLVETARRKLLDDVSFRQ